MKILESYKKIAKSMLTEHAWDRKFGEPLPTLEDVMREAEVDDDKIIKYKDKDGESQEMTAGAAKKMDKDHPAKQVWDKMADKGGEEEPKSKGLEPDDFERDFDPEKPEDEPSDMDTEKPDDSDDDKPDSFDARKILAKMSRKELAKTKWPFDPEDEDNYLGSPDYDPEDDSFKPPNLDGLEDMDYTTLKQKYMDLLAHKAQMEYDIEDADSQDDPAWEKESQEKWSTAVKNQNRILKLLTPQQQTVGMGGRSTRGGIGIRDSVEINGKKYKKVKEHAWDRKFGEPLPTLTDVMKVKEEKKDTEKHSLRETYERIGGK